MEFSIYIGETPVNKEFLQSDNYKSHWQDKEIECMSRFYSCKYKVKPSSAQKKKASV